MLLHGVRSGRMLPKCATRLRILAGHSLVTALANNERVKVKKVAAMQSELIEQCTAVDTSGTAHEQHTVESKITTVVDERPTTLNLPTTSRLENVPTRQLQMRRSLAGFSPGAFALSLLYIALWMVKPLPWLALLIVALTLFAWKGVPVRLTNKKDDNGDCYKPQESPWLTWQKLRSAISGTALATVAVLIIMRISGQDSAIHVMAAQLDSESSNIALALVSNGLVLLILGLTCAAICMVIALLIVPICHLSLNIVTVVKHLLQFPLYLHGQPAEAKIVSVHQRADSQWSVVVAFEATDEKGESSARNVRLDVYNEECGRLKEGDSVTVLYNKRDPQECLVYELGQYQIKLTGATAQVETSKQTGTDSTPVVASLTEYRNKKILAPK
jgi:hypothetical protein